MTDSPKASFDSLSDFRAMYSSNHDSFVFDLIVDLISSRSPAEGWAVYQGGNEELSSADSDNSLRSKAGRIVVFAKPATDMAKHSIVAHRGYLPDDYVNVQFSASAPNPFGDKSELVAFAMPNKRELSDPPVDPDPSVDRGLAKIRLNRWTAQSRRLLFHSKEGRTFDPGRGQKHDPLQSSERPSNQLILTLVNAFLESLSAARHVIDEIDPDEANDLGAKAAEEVIASARWSRLVGDRIDTSEASRVLGISRQALSKRQASGSLLGLPGHNTTWYPTWQFDAERESIRPEVRDIIGAFRDALGEGADPFLIASWASTAQHEDLEGSSPAEWLADGSDVERLRQAAQRAAERSAQ